MFLAFTLKVLRFSLVSNLLLFACKHLSIDDLALFSIVLWNIWSARNKLVFDNIYEFDQLILEEAGQFLFEFQGCYKIETPTSCRQNVDLRWKPPDEGLLKLNTDAAFVEDLNTTGTGIVGPDFKGHVLGCASKKFGKVSSPFVAELI
ncbi:non-LTR retroelement reverse transcriptase [Parasponia andersonii]|uniref:Non-LTR retroelement reverse transcriptase n=1 Tax=Parasponia andersonii TaxID=3476 RepID=A0A2P5B484_PARAD|nr:non-LTR retroelement reverse transcriptase [Parasponia andersonii]